MSYSVFDKVFESHVFLKQKKDHSIKGRMGIGGNKQRGNIDKTDATSPTAALESVLLTSTIDPKEGRDVAIIDIPNAFITTRIEDKKDIVIVRLRGKLAELMVATAPEIYKKYVSINRKGEVVFYVEDLNDLYGIMKAALLFYLKFVKNLKSIGFVLNPYDPCVANNIVDGAQLTVVFHVDNLKVSYVDAVVVTRMSVWIQKICKRLFDDGSGAMKLKRGKIHNTTPTES